MSLIEKLITVDCQTADAPSLLSRSKIKTPRCGSLASCSLPYYPSHRLDNHGKQKVHQNQKKVLVLQMRLSQGLVSQSRNLSLLSRSLSRNLSFQQAKLPPVVSPCWQRTRWRCSFAGNISNMRILMAQFWVKYGEGYKIQTFSFQNLVWNTLHFPGCGLRWRLGGESEWGSG